MIDSIALIFDVPTIILSGFSKSVIADPSLKNSGFETTSNFLLGFFLDIISSILSHVPTGTVDFTIIILLSWRECDISSAQEYIWDKSTLSPSGLVGVPTAINIIFDIFSEDSIFEEKDKFSAFKFFLTRLSNPGSYIGIRPSDKLSILFLSLSIQITLCPASDKQTPVTSPT